MFQRVCEQCRISQNFSLFLFSSTRKQNILTNLLVQKLILNRNIVIFCFNYVVKPVQLFIEYMGFFLYLAIIIVNIT